MINIKNIFKVLLVAMFVCAYSNNVLAQDFGIPGSISSNFYTPDPLPSCPAGTKHNKVDNSCRDISTGSIISYLEGKTIANINAENDALKKKAEDPKDDNNMGGNYQVESIDFCSGNLGIFEDLVKTGQKIFNRLRDLIYVVAGFGIIAVAVGGFFGNLNWKWLGAIVISLVVIATAGELIVLLTGCETFNGALITNTLTSPSKTGAIVSHKQFEDEYLVDMYSASGEGSGATSIVDNNINGGENLGGGQNLGN